VVEALGLITSTKKKTKTKTKHCCDIYHTSIGIFRILGVFFSLVMKRTTTCETVRAWI
jgi:hypothetical protein